MEEMFAKISKAFEDQVEKAGEKPITTAIKIFLVAWLTKKAYNIIKEA